MLDTVILRTTEPQFALALVEMRYDTGAHDIYQLLYTLRDGEPEIDELDDPQLARELVSAMRSGLKLQGTEGLLEFAPIDGFAGLGRELADARAVGAEQSNTSVVFDDELILRSSAGSSRGSTPARDVAIPHRARFRELAPLGGFYTYSGGPLGATLGILQQFVEGGIDGWELGLDEIVAATRSASSSACTGSAPSPARCTASSAPT